MSNKFEINSVVTGKVVDIKPFGAFVALDENTKGLVHISQVSHDFVKDINNHLTVGQEVQVKILSIDEQSGKISLSIREATQRPNRKQQAKKEEQVQNTNNVSLEDKLKEWLKQSNERQADLNKRNNRR
ncbi:general stress protein 13 [Alkalithermobacter thermoalcaliphilus JW-YL-7 = DSM 7308]|uniref:General stress protein 13 n=1 Tax=Alkalithermobacter thermoalcaliphilus JW-YL-7 = DSM 7308 TaxID=1121328 RepID=A0A150FRB1_CLOPD|nr:RNA binding S1 domain protein [[Clostridium] paradoxum JW-YL-7 = DSM 7308]SHK97193.1 general stress protein 13 [[Clostridium] paradoxum JW-YL-7 = DSM 7308]